jgi:hypothetical protein
MRKISSLVNSFVFERVAARLTDTGVHDLRAMAAALADSAPLRALLRWSDGRPHEWVGGRLWVFADDRERSKWK